MIILKNKIIKALHEYLHCDIVPTDSTAERPPYPFLSYKVTAPYEHGKSFALIDKALSEHDIELTKREHVYFTISFSGYSNEDHESYCICESAFAWFEFIGYEYLKDELNIIVSNVSNIQDRTTQLVDYYESRWGFDVKFKIVHEISKTIEAIESYNLQIR